MGLINRLFGFAKGFLLSEDFKSGKDTSSLESIQQFDFEAYSDKFQGYYLDYPKVKSAVISVAGQVLGEGIFLSPSTRKRDGKEEEYQRSLDAKEKCDEFNEEIDINQLVFNIALRTVKYGSCFIEKTWEPIYSAQLVEGQKYMKPVWTGNKLSGWELSRMGAVKAKWSVDEIIHTPWDVDVNYPFGTSLLTGIDRDTDTLDHITKNVNKYMERQAWATDVLQIGDKEYTPGAEEVEELQRRVRNRAIGETIITNYPIDHQVMGGGEMETQMVPDMLKFVDDQIADSLMAPPLSKLYSSTEASATIITDWCRAILINPLQQIIKSKLKWELYYPYLEDLGYSVKTVPDVMFDTPEAGRNSEADYWMKLNQIGVASPKQICKELGIPYDEDYWSKNKPQNFATFGVNQGGWGNQNQPKQPEKTGPKPEVTPQDE